MAQGPYRNTCLAVAATGGHEYLRRGQRLSIEHLWANARARAGVGPDGATMSSIRDGVVIDGQCEESIWPYDPVAPMPRPSSIQTIYKVERGEIVIGADLDALRATLSAGHGLVLGLELTESFQLAAGLPIDFESDGEGTLGNHAVLGVGFDDDQELIVIKNSWGTTWGDAGYAPITYRYVRRYGRRMLRLEG